MKAQTFSILFWIEKSREKNGKANLSARITVDGKRVEISAQRKVSIIEWDPDAQMVMSRTAEAKEINNHIIAMKAKLLSCQTKLEAREEPITAETVKNEYIGKRVTNKTVIEAFTEYNQLLRDRVDAVEPTMKVTTWIGFVTTRQKVIQYFEHAYHVKDMYLKNVPEVFAEELLLYLTTYGKLTSNTAMKHVKATKQMFRWAKRKGYLVVNPMTDFKCFFKQPKRPRLTWAEIISLYQLQLSQTVLDEVRDVYLFSCFTGYSYMDVFELSMQNIMPWIDGTKWIVRDRYKGGHNKSNVPLMDVPLQIIEKYNNHPCRLIQNKLLPVKKNQAYNKYLKKIATIAGINKNLSAHTARHTFATTVLLENDCPIESVSEMLGHNSIKTTQIYAKATDVKVRNNMKDVRIKIAKKIKALKTGS
jgi:site-specific recombinase XerD